MSNRSADFSSNVKALQGRRIICRHWTGIFF